MLLLLSRVKIINNCYSVILLSFTNVLILKDLKGCISQKSTSSVPQRRNGRKKNEKGKGKRPKGKNIVEISKNTSHCASDFI